MKNILKFGLIAVLGCFLVSVAHATTIDTFSVTQTWGVPGGLAATASGTFSGKVEGDGYIEQGDLSSFSFSYVFPGEKFNFSQSQLSLFSFDTNDFLSNGSTSTLDLIATTSAMNGSSSGTETLCIGAAAAFGVSPCAANPPDETRGSFTFFANSLDFTSMPPTITLVASAMTGAPSRAATPEPDSLLLFGTGLLALAVLMRKKLWLVVRD